MVIKDKLRLTFNTRSFSSNQSLLVNSPPTETSEGVSLQLGNTKDFIISFDLKFLTNGSVSVVLETTEKNQLFTIHYVSNTQLIAFKERDIYYGIGPRTSWSTVTRDLVTDLRKGVGLSNTKAVKPTKIMPKKVVRRKAPCIKS